MSKPFGLILIALVFMGCVSRTEYGRRRLLQIGKHQNLTDRRVYAFIDTSKLYEIVSAVSIADGMPLTSVNKVYLKFYENGRVGTFYAYHPEDIGSLNPKRAEIGYYKYNGNDLEIKTFFEHPQGGGWIKDRVMKSNPDTIRLISQGIASKYKMLDIPLEALIYKPDW